jgi:hypothetical protein
MILHCLGLPRSLRTIFQAGSKRMITIYSGKLWRCHLHVAFLSLLTLVSGCFSPKTYLDPQFRKVSYGGLTQAEHPRAVVVDVQFQFNGQEKQQTVPYLHDRVTKVLRRSKLFYETNNYSGPTARMKIVINNFGSVGSAIGKGLGTGLSLGLIGSDVVDGYEMAAAYTPPEGGVSLVKNYKHELHTTIGLQKAPAGLEPVNLAVAFDEILEDMLLNFLSDLQREKVL